MLQLNIVNYHTGEFRQKIFQPNDAEKLSWLVGRKSNCDIVLASPEVSRIHGKFSWEENKYYFTDLGSSDGSRINSKDIDRDRNYPLKEQDLVLIGNFIIAIDKIDNKIEESEDKTSLFNSLPKWKGEDLLVKCQQIIEETADVKTFRFVANSPLLFTYEPGQFVNLEIEIAGKPVVRSYSISSAPSRPSTLEITVKRVPAPKDALHLPAGLVSNWLHDNLRVGSEVKLIGGAMGQFTCTTKPPRKILMISAGSGITPMLSMSRWIYDTVADCDVVFFHNARTPQDIIMRQELEAIATRHHNFRLAISITRPEEILPWQNWFGLTGRFNETMLKNIAPDFKERVVYVCGANGFMQEVKQILTRQDFPMSNYHQESFGGKKPKRKKLSSQPVTQPEIQDLPAPAEAMERKPNTMTSTNPVVFFSQQGKEVPCDEEESILEAAEASGIPIRSGCRQGVCGACKKRKLEGEIRYDGEANSTPEDDDILTCIAFPVGRVVIEA